MTNLKTTYLGIPLRNPLMVSSCSQTNTVEKIKKLEEAGVAAVVLKSLFEEQMIHEAVSLQHSGDYYPEAADYLQTYITGHSVAEYLNLITDAKKAVKIPVIASVNCMSATGWLDYAKKMEDAGADAIEINVNVIPTDKNLSAAGYEKQYFDVAEALSKILKIPFSFKLGNHFTNLPYVVDQLYFRGAKGVVLFNRFYEPDINIKDMTLKSADVFSSSTDLRYLLRWLSIVSATVEEIQIAASTGVHDASGLIRTLLAGAQVTQVCSVLYQKGITVLTQMLDGLTEWMKVHNFSSVDAFRGNLNYKNIDNPQLYERSQFMKYFSSYE